MNTGIIFLGILGALPLLWIAWISLQSLLQGVFLRSVPHISLTEAAEQGGLIEGRVEVSDPLKPSSTGPCLWRRITIQQRGSDSVVGYVANLSGNSRRSTWRTVSDGYEMASFSIVVGSERVRVDGEPTEIQGQHSRTNRGDSGLFDGWFGGGLQSKEIVRWLPQVPRLTVLGKVERKDGGWVLSRDPLLGLLLTPHPPGRAALFEFLKAAAGFAVAIGGAVFLVLFLRQNWV